MSRIIVPSRRVWTRQPQRPAGIDWTNPLNLGLVSVQDAKTGRDVIRGGGTLYNAASITSSVSAKGVGTNYNQNQIDFPVGPDLSSKTEGTILFVGGLQHGTWNVAAINHGMAVRRYNENLCFGHGVNEVGYDVTAWTGISTFCGAWRGSVAASSAYLDGVKLTQSYSSSSDTAAFSTSTLGGALSGDRSSATYWAKPCLLSLRWSRALTDSELALVSANPWQIFKPRTRRTSIDLGAGSGTNTSLTISEALHAHNVDALLLSWQDLLTVSDSNHAHTADSLTLSTQWLLAVQEALHAHAADNIGLSATGSASLSVQDSTHAHLADALTLVTTWLLSVADSKHGHAADNLTLDTSNATWLTVQESFHAHTADNVAMTLDTWLAIVDAAHAHYADAQTITVDASLAVAEALHAVYSESVRLGIPGLYVRAPNGPGYRRLMINVTRPKQRNTVRH